MLCMLVVMTKGDLVTGLGFVLVLLMSGLEPMPHNFQAFWIHIGLLMIGVGMMAAGVWMRWKRI